MADAKITSLTADTTPTTDDLVVTVNDPAGTPGNKKVTLGDLFTNINGQGVVRNRQGGTTGDNDWTTTGTSNTDVSAKKAIIQCGAATGSAAASVAVTFPAAFNFKPLVVATAITNTQVVFVNVSAITASGFSFDVVRDTGARSAQDVAWIAIGQ
jgi:hypothetical protein